MRYCHTQICLRWLEKQYSPNGDQMVFYHGRIHKSITLNFNKQTYVNYIYIGCMRLYLNPSDESEQICQTHSPAGTPKMSVPMCLPALPLDLNPRKDYLEDHPRTRKWLGSPPLISHEWLLGRGTTLLRGFTNHGYQVMFSYQLISYHTSS